MKLLAVTCASVLVASACSRDPADASVSPSGSAPKTTTAATATTPTPAATPPPSGPFVPSTAIAALERDLDAARSHDDPARFERLLRDAAVLAARLPDEARPRQIHTIALLAVGRAKEALPAARALATQKPDLVSFGLLADASLATGDVEGSGAAVEQMMDLAPGLPTYARAAELRFRTGDVDGSLEMWRTAFQSGHKEIAEAMAYTAVGAGDAFLYGKGDLEQADRSYDAALRSLPKDAAALLGKARVQLARGLPCDVAAIDEAARDADVVSVAADCAAAGGAPVAPALFAAQVDEVAARDRRSAAVALATRKVNLARARALADEQARDAGGLEDDDALAWVLMRQGDIDGAVPHARRALSSSTADVRVQARMALVLSGASDAKVARTGRALLQKVSASAAFASGVEPLVREEIRVTLLP